MTANKRKVTAIIIAAVILSAASVISVMAYLANKDQKENSFTVGTVGDKTRDQISEVFSEPELQLENQTVTKTVTVRNNSTKPCFVRLYVDFSDSLIADKAYVTANNDTVYKWSGTGGFLETMSTTGIGNWKYVPADSTAYGGYFYYTQPLAAKNGDTIASTEPLFKSVKTDFSTTPAAGLTIEDYIDEYNIIVYSETVQTVETDSTGTDYAEVTNGYETAWKSFLKVPTP